MHQAYFGLTTDQFQEKNQMVTKLVGEECLKIFLDMKFYLFLFLKSSSSVCGSRSRGREVAVMLSQMSHKRVRHGRGCLRGEVGVSLQKL